MSTRDNGHYSAVMALARPRNDLRQYDDLAGHWVRPDGEFAALHWIAAARARHLPPPRRRGAVLLDVACGGGLLAPHVPPGYRHIGVDRTRSALDVARRNGVVVVQGDVTALPLPAAGIDVVVAGEIFEHVTDLPAAVAECARVLAPGGTLVCDTIADTWWARFSLVTVGERLPGGPPRGIHDPRLFVAPQRLVDEFARHGVRLRCQGLQAHPLEFLRYQVTRRGPVRMVPSRSLNALYQGVGTKEPA